MGSHRERFLHNLPTVVALLCGKPGVHSDDLMSSTCSLGSENVEERAPAGAENGFRKVMVFDHVEDTQVLNGNTVRG
jgi:hypothetical protein